MKECKVNIQNVDGTLMSSADLVKCNANIIRKSKANKIAIELLEKQQEKIRAKKLYKKIDDEYKELKAEYDAAVAKVNGSQSDVSDIEIDTSDEESVD